MPIPVSTRGIGFSVQETFTRVTAIEENVRRLNPMTVFQFYRVMLGMVEHKVFENRHYAAIDIPNDWYDPIQFEEFRTAITSINICTQRI